MFEKLGHTELVVQFQHFCGLRWKNEKPDVSGAVQTIRSMSDEVSANGLENVNKSSCMNGSVIHDEKAGNKYEYISFLHTLFYVSSALGDEQVLIAVLSFIFWNIDPRAVMRVYISLAVSLYLGQGAKDIFMAPRPASPPVIRVERKYAEEYSMPSTHAMMGMVVPFSLVYFTHENFEYHIVPALIAAAICCCLVGASRVYLGMHSVKDVLFGMVFECAIIAVTFPCMRDIDLEKWCHTSPNVLSTAFILPIMLLLVYPTSTPKSYNTYSDTALVLGIVAGSIVGLRFSASNEKLMLDFVVKTHGMSAFQYISFSMLRYAVGTVLLTLTRIIMKWSITSSLSRLLPSSMIMKPLGYKRFVEIPHKFVTYGMVAFNCIYWAPKLFNLVGL